MWTREEEWGKVEVGPLVGSRAITPRFGGRGGGRGWGSCRVGLTHLPFFDYRDAFSCVAACHERKHHGRICHFGELADFQLLFSRVGKMFSPASVRTSGV